MAWVLIQRPENKIWNLSYEQFQVLTLCDGETWLPNNQIDEKLIEVLQQCESKGWIEACEQSNPLMMEQYYLYYDNRYIRSVFWSVTGKCNYKCRHCFMDAPEGMLGEISTEQALDFIDQMDKCGVLNVDLTGGELFVRKDIWQLIDYILLHQIRINTIYTNGWFVNDELLNEFEKRGIKPEFSVSFDGIGWHDWMRGIPGAEKAALQALQLLHNRGFPTDVEICIHKGNKDILSQTVIALKGKGVEYIKVGNVNMTPIWRKNNEGKILADRDYVEEMLKYITWYYQAGQPIEQLMLTNVITLRKNQPYEIIPEPYDGTKDCLNKFLCESARMDCYITPEGRLLPCMPMTSSPAQELFPRVQDIGLKQGLTDSFYMQFVDGRVKDLLEANAECNACAYRYKCGGGCRANALIEGDQKLMGCDRNMCMLWKEGYVERIRKAADDAIAKYGVPSKKGGSSEVDT